MLAKFFIGAMLFVVISARSIDWGGDIVYLVPYGEFEIEEPEYSHRVRRQTQGSITYDSSGKVELGGTAKLAGNDEKMLSVHGTRDSKGGSGFGVALDHVNGHGLQVTKKSIPGFGDALTGAGHVTVFHNDNHDLKANAFVSRSMPDHPQVPNFNTYGGGADYTYKEKVGASLGMSNTPFLDRNDYSAKANLNLFRSPTSSLDFGAGVQKFKTPHFSSSWEPFAGVTYTSQFPKFFSFN